MKAAGRPPQFSVEEKREKVFAAAFDCILQYGYSKTSLEDIARKAGISRSSLYQLFKNKEDLVSSLAEEMMNEKLAMVETEASAPGAKVYRCLELWVIDIYALIRESAHGEELFEISESMLANLKIEKNQQFIGILEGLVKDRQLAEVLLYSAMGLRLDNPPVKILKKRIKLLLRRMHL